MRNTLLCAKPLRFQCCVLHLITLKIQPQIDGIDNSHHLNLIFTIKLGIRRKFFLLSKELKSSCNYSSSMVLPSKIMLIKRFFGYFFSKDHPKLNYIERYVKLRHLPNYFYSSLISRLEKQHLITVHWAACPSNLKTMACHLPCKNLNGKYLLDPSFWAGTMTLTAWIQMYYGWGDQERRAETPKLLTSCHPELLLLLSCFSRV